MDNTTETNKRPGITFEQMVELGWIDGYRWFEETGGFDRNLQNLVLEAVRNYTHRSEELGTMADQLIRDLEGVKRHLEAGYHVNSLGELQSQGPRFDILCARREDAAEVLSRAIYVFNKVQDLEVDA